MANKIQCKCIVCGKEFIQETKGFSKKYCSKECKSLNTKRLAVQWRLNYKNNLDNITLCEICGKPTNSIKAHYCDQCRHTIRSQRMQGQNNPSVKNPPKGKLSAEARQHLSERMKGHSNSMGTLGINNGKINKRILPEQLNDYLTSGWVLGWYPGTINNKAPYAKLSKAAQILYEGLKDNPNYEVNLEVAFPNCKFKKQLPFDFGIYKKDEPSELLFLLEYDGTQHYKPFKWQKNKNPYKAFISRQINDWIKDRFCVEESIPLIRVKENYTYPLSFENIYKNENITQIGKEYGTDNFFQCFDILQCDTVNNQKISFTIESGITCTFKCDLENKCQYCQNFALTKQAPKTLTIDRIIELYTTQSLAKCISFQGLEPLDSLKQLLWFIYKFRKVSLDPLYIWTGYTEEECSNLITLIQAEGWKNIIVKFGRFRPGQKPHLDPILQVPLASSNQYAKQIS